MPKLINPLGITITVSTGTGSSTVSNLKNMTLSHFFVNPTNDTTEYAVTIVDAGGFTIFKKSGIYKDLVVTSKENLPSNIGGNFTITITADNDEDFDLNLYIMDNL